MRAPSQKLSNKPPFNNCDEVFGEVFLLKTNTVEAFEADF